MNFILESLKKKDKIGVAVFVVNVNDDDDDVIVVVSITVVIVAYVAVVYSNHMSGQYDPLCREKVVEDLCYTKVTGSYWPPCRGLQNESRVGIGLIKDFTRVHWHPSHPT